MTGLWGQQSVQPGNNDVSHELKQVCLHAVPIVCKAIADASLCSMHCCFLKLWQWFCAADLHADPGLIPSGLLCRTRNQLQHGMHRTYASLCRANSMDAIERLIRACKLL